MAALSLALLLETSHLARDNSKSLGHIVISVCVCVHVGGWVHKFYSEVGTLLLKKKGMHTGLKEHIFSQVHVAVVLILQTRGKDYFGT